MDEAKQPPKAALYLRTSTQEQHTANQKPDVYALIKARGFEIIDIFEEQGSAAALRRPKLDAMLGNAKRGKYDVIVVWSLDRLSRSMRGMIDIVLDLDQRGVRVASCREPWAEMDGAMKSLTVAVMGFCAQFERERLIERTRAGMARARAEGRRIGRPRAQVDLDRVLDLDEEGKSVREIARAIGLSATTVHKALKTARAHAALRGGVRNGASNSSLISAETATSISSISGFAS